jgi:hypothetical protein
MYNAYFAFLSVGVGIQRLNSTGDLLRQSVELHAIIGRKIAMVLEEAAGNICVQAKYAAM